MASLETEVAFSPDLLLLQVFGDSAFFYNDGAPRNEEAFYISGETPAIATPVISAYGEEFAYEGGGANGDVPVEGEIAALQFGAFIGSEYEFGFAVTGLELSAAEFADVVISETLDDDLALIAKIFRGDDDLTGSNKGDVLDGLAGKDTLEGGGGKDVFRLSQKAGGANADEIIDFKVGKDVIELSKDIFTKVKFDGKGDLAKGTFVVGEEAADGRDRIIYDDESGKLFYDKNGSGRGGQKLIATLDDHLDLTRGDFDLFVA
jgi:Ca2+-binding RTX toxin-like protein